MARLQQAHGGDKDEKRFLPQEYERGKPHRRPGPGLPSGQAEPGDKRGRKCGDHHPQDRGLARRFDGPACAVGGQNEGDGTPQAGAAVIEPVFRGRSRGEVFTQRDQRHEHGARQHIDDEKRPETVGEDEQKVGRQPSGSGDHDDLLVRAGPVGEMADEGIREGADPGSDREDQADLGGIEPAVVQPRGPERQVDADGEKDRRVIE